MPPNMLSGLSHIRQWNLRTSPGGILRLCLPTSFAAAVQINPLDPHTSSWNSARVALSLLPTADKKQISKETADAWISRIGLNVWEETTGGISFVNVDMKAGPVGETAEEHSGFKGEAQVLISVEIPGRFGLSVEKGGGLLELIGTFEGDVHLRSGGDVKIEKLKSMRIYISAQNGSVQGGVFQGNLNLSAGGGKVDLQRVQGPSVDVNGSGGDVRIGALYAEKAEIDCDMRNVSIGVAQGETAIRSHGGKVEVGDVEGGLEVRSAGGKVVVGINEVKEVSVWSEGGDVEVGVGNGGGQFEVEGEGVLVEEGVLEGVVEEEMEVGKFVTGDSGGEGLIVVRAGTGYVRLKRRRWGMGLGLKNGGH